LSPLITLGAGFGSTHKIAFAHDADKADVHLHDWASS